MVGNKLDIDVDKNLHHLLDIYVDIYVGHFHTFVSIVLWVLWEAPFFFGSKDR